MRTTLAIDDDVLSAAKEMATLQRKTVGEVISALARRAMSEEGAARRRRTTRNGVPLLTVRRGSVPVTSELVQRLREELP